MRVALWMQSLCSSIIPPIKVLCADLACLHLQVSVDIEACEVLCASMCVFALDVG